MSKFDISAGFLNRSIPLFKKNKDKFNLSITYGNLGTLYFSQGKYNKARDFFLKALNISKEIGLITSIGTYTLNIGNTYIIEYKFNTALKYVEDCLNLLLFDNQNYFHIRQYFLNILFQQV